MDKKLLEAALAAAAQGDIRKYEIDVPGVVSVRADGPDDHKRALEALDRMRVVIPGLPRFAMPAQKTGPMLHAAITGFLQRFRQTSRAPATLLETAHTLELFRDLVDDVPLANVGNEQTDVFREAMSHWPARARVFPQFKNLSARAIVAKGKSMPEVPKLQVRTVEKHLDRLRVFFNEAVKRRELAHNPLHGVRLQTTAAKYEPVRRAFRAHELLLVFDPARRAKLAHDPMYFWFPPLGLFLGGRLRELAELTVFGVEQLPEINVWGLHILEGRKNSQSKRFVPLPDRVLAMGFLDYIEDVKAAGFEAAFPGGSVNAKNGAGDRVSRWFNRTYLDKACGLDDPQLCFHAFRNTQQTAADVLKISESQIAPISGHAPRSVQARHYIDPATVKARKKRLDRIANHYQLPPLAPYRRGQFDEYFAEVRANEKHTEAKAARAATAAREKAKRGG